MERLYWVLAHAHCAHGLCRTIFPPASAHRYRAGKWGIGRAFTSSPQWVGMEEKRIRSRGKMRADFFPWCQTMNDCQRLSSLGRVGASSAAWTFPEVSFTYFKSPRPLSPFKESSSCSYLHVGHNIVCASGLKNSTVYHKPLRLTYTTKYVLKIFCIGLCTQDFST